MAKNDQSLCPVCDSQDIQTLLEIPDLPVFCNMLLPSAKAALGTVSDSMALGYCTGCQHIFNQLFKPELMVYSQAYENSLHFSERFQAYAELLVHDLQKKYNFNGKSVIEIGCGKGDFLKTLCQAGFDQCVGFDTSFEDQTLEEEFDGRLKVYKDYYSKAYSHLPADFVCCRHVLEHIQAPVSFLKQIRTALIGQNPILFFEVPNMMYTLRDMGIWDLIYEHCGYFTSSSLTKAFHLAGFQVLDIYETFGGQFLCIEATQKNGTSEDLTWQPDWDIDRLARVFADQYQQKIRHWKIFLQISREKGKKIAVWGAGSKGITFLNLFVEFIDILGVLVDINPRKHGKFAPGTGHEIASVNSLLVYKPDIVLVMNSNYLLEIQNMLDTLDISAHILEV